MSYPTVKPPPGRTRIWTKTNSAVFSRSDTTGKFFMPKHHHLPTRVDTVAWGFFDAALAPALTIESGDTVSIDSLPAGDVKELPPNASRIRPDHRLLLDKAVRGNGPHPVNGPIYVKGAEPGDVLQIDILGIEPNQDWGFVAIMPLLGTLPDEFTDYETVIVDIDATQNV